jgi:uncharacterized membrane protein YeiH
MSKEKVVEEVATATGEVFKSIIDAVGPAVREIATSMGTSTEQLLAIIVKQQYANAIDSFCCVIIFSILGFCWYRYSTYWFKKMEKDEHGLRDWDIDGFAPNMILSVVFALVVVIAISTGFIGGIKRMMNPEYYAYQEIMDEVKDVLGK